MNTIDIMKNGHQTVLKTIDGLPEADWYTPGVCGIWSVKEIIAHLASFEHLLIDLLHSLGDNGPTPTLDRFKADVQQFNNDEVSRRRHRSVQEGWAEYQTAYEQTVALMAQIPVEGGRLNGTLPWYGPEYDLEDFIVYTFYGHKREHGAQIAIIRDRLAGVTMPALPDLNVDIVS